MVLTTLQKRAWLSWCYDSDTGSNLLAALKAQRNAKGDKNSSGLIVSGSSAVSHSTSFSEPSRADVSPMALFCMWQELVDLFTASKADLVTAGDPTPTDAEVLAEMLYRLSDVRTHETTYTGVMP